MPRRNWQMREWSKLRGELARMRKEMVLARLAASPATRRQIEEEFGWSFHYTQAIMQRLSMRGEIEIVPERLTTRLGHRWRVKGGDHSPPLTT
jgi:hypothetical protein